MRILVLSASYFPVLGGLQTAVQSLVGEWQKAGHEVQVITQRYPRCLTANECVDGVPVWRHYFITPEKQYLKQARFDLYLAGLWYQKHTRRWLLQKIEEFSPDIVNLHFPDAQIPFILDLQNICNFPLVVSLHGHDVERWIRKESTDGGSYNTQFEQFRSVLQAADFVTACSEHLLRQARYLELAITTKSTAISNGIDLARFQDDTCYPHRKPYILAIGRFTSNKGFDLLLSAFAKWEMINKDYDLLIAGDGEQKAFLQSETRRLDIEERVVFLGRISQQQIVQLLNGCRFLVIPSRQESFGIVGLEGLAAGKLVLATNVGGIPEVLSGTQNRLVEPTVDGLVSGLQGSDLATNLTTVANDNRQQAAKFSWRSVASKYLDVFQAVIRKENPVS